MQNHQDDNHQDDAQVQQILDEEEKKLDFNYPELESEEEIQDEVQIDQTLIGIGKQCTIFKAKDQKLFGRGLEFQKKLAGRDNIPKNQKLFKIKSPDLKQIFPIANSTLALDLSISKLHQLGNYLKTNGNVVKIALEDGHCLLLNSEGTLYRCNLQEGYEQKQQRYRISPVSFVVLPNYNNPQLKKEYPVIKQIVASEKNSYALSYDGNVYSWGFNDHGQLGLGDQYDNFTESKQILLSNDSNEQLAFLKISQKKCKFDKISCGENHVLALTKTGHVYSWGNNNFGQLGLKANKDDQPRLSLNKPDIKIDYEEIKFSEIAAGANHSLVLSTDKKLFTFGKNDSGQCGIDIQYEKKNIFQMVFSRTPQQIKSQDNIQTPTKKKKVKDVIQIFAGHDQSFFIKNDKTYFGFGDNQFNQIDESDVKLIDAPKELVYARDFLNE